MPAGQHAAWHEQNKRQCDGSRLASPLVQVPINGDSQSYFVEDAVSSLPPGRDFCPTHSPAQVAAQGDAFPGPTPAVGDG